MTQRSSPALSTSCRLTHRLADINSAAVSCAWAVEWSHGVWAAALSDGSAALTRRCLPGFGLTSPGIGKRCRVLAKRLLPCYSPDGSSGKLPIRREQRAWGEGK